MIKKNGVVPILSDIPDREYYIGESISINLQTYVKKTENDWLIVDVNGTLPDGLSINKGKITGTSTMVGPYKRHS